MAQTKTNKPRKLRHSTYREERGRDRRAAKRTERETLTIVLMPALFERRMEVA